MKTNSKLLIFLLLPILVFVASCGGGTSGTSSPTPLMLTGYAEQADGSRGAGLTMSVRSGSTFNPLLNSRTDQNGIFSMELPADERSFVIDVEGVGSTQISRSQSGEGNIATKLTVASNGNVITQDLFEAQLSSGNPCSAIEVYKNRVVIVAPITEASCKVEIITTSNELPRSNFLGTLTGTCPDLKDFSIDTRSNPQGILTLDLAPALLNGCFDLTILITHGSSPGLESSFSVNSEMY